MRICNLTAKTRQIAKIFSISRTFSLEQSLQSVLNLCVLVMISEEIAEKKIICLQFEIHYLLITYTYFSCLGSKHGERKCYEQHEIPDQTRCPVKLYEFYLSKW